VNLLVGLIFPKYSVVLVEKANSLLIGFRLSAVCASQPVVAERGKEMNSAWNIMGENEN
jgi:hypothetical protein